MLSRLGCYRDPGSFATDTAHLVRIGQPLSLFGGTRATDEDTIPRPSCPMRRILQRAYRRHVSEPQVGSWRIDLGPLKPERQAFAVIDRALPQWKIGVD